MKRFIRACLLGAGGCCLFGIGSCLTTKWVGNVVTGAASLTAHDLLDVFIIQDLTRDERVNNQLEDEELAEELRGDGGTGG